MIILYIAECEALKSPEVFGKYLVQAGDERREKALRCRSPKGRALSLGAGLLLKRAVEDCGLSPLDTEACALVKNEYGKPYFADERLAGRYFSLSHSGSYCICALSGREIGADIQQTGEAGLRSAKRVMHENEYREFTGLPEYERIQAFYRLWTMKEAYLKFIGKGFYEAPASVELKSLDCTFLEPCAPEGYCLSICCRSRDELECRTVVF